MYPSAEQFSLDLTTLYYLAISPPKVLCKPFLTMLVSVFAEIYAKQFNPISQPNIAYDLMLRTTLEALQNLTDKIHPSCLEQSPSKALFWTTHALRDFVIQHVPGNSRVKEQWLFEPGQREAYESLAEPFKRRRSEFEALRLLNWKLVSPTDIFREPENWLDDKDEIRRYEKKKKQYDKDVAKAWEEITSYELAVILTPLYPYADRLLPQGTIDLPFEIPKDLRFQGHWICGTQGSGKSTLLKTLFLEDLKSVRDGRASIIIMDSSGEFLDYAAHLRLFAKGQPLDGKLVLLKPEEKYPLALNPLDIGASPAHAIDLLEYVFSALRDTKTTALQSTLFRSVFMALQVIPNASLATFRSFLVDGWKQYEKEIRTLHPEDRDFFLKGEFDSKDYRDTKGQVLWRLRDLTTRVPLLREMFNSPETRVDIGDLMSRGKVICIDNRRDLLSDSGSEFFARFFLALIRAAADQRSKLAEHQKVPTYIYIDECQNVIENDENVEKIIAECRKQKIALILAHQFWSQITNDKVKSALSNCAIRFVNVDDDAAQLAPRMRTEAENLRLPTGSFAAFVRTKTDAAVTIKVPPPPPMETMTSGEFDAIQKEMRARFCYGQQSDSSEIAYDLEWEITISPRMAEEGCKKQISDFIVTIPPGTKSGDRFRLKSKGAPKPDGTFGDAYLTVNVPARPNQRSIGSGDSGLNEWG